jgi:hypothetical protein
MVDKADSLTSLICSFSDKRKYLSQLVSSSSESIAGSTVVSTAVVEVLVDPQELVDKANKETAKITISVLSLNLSII